MHRCYLAPEQWEAASPRPDPEDAHHLRHVLRLQPGDALTVFDGRGRRAQARIGEITRGGRELTFLLDLDSQAQSPLPAPVILVQAILKGPRMDLLVEKAVELGVTRLVPVRTARAVVRLDGRAADDRRERWQRIATGAGRQCGGDWLPRVAPVTDLADALRTEGQPPTLALVGALTAEAQSLRAVLEAARQRHPVWPPVAVAIGPEGDFTPDEYAAARAAGWRPVTFGERVLRAETAAMHALSAIAYAGSDPAGLGGV